MDTRISFGLSPEQKAWQERVRDFVNTRVRPVAHIRERLEDPGQRHPWNWVEELSSWGLRTATVPKALGGLGFSVLDCCVVGEELGVGDLGLAVIFDQTWKLTPWLTEMATEAQREQFLPEFLRDHRHLLALGLSEPDSGSDNFLPYGKLGDGVKTTAVATVREGRSGWLLNGVKAPISNGGSARLYIILARAGAVGAETAWLTPFFVPADAPGFSVQFIYDKSGQRLVHNGHLVLDGCWVPEENRIHRRTALGDERGFPEGAATVLGVARAAYEDAYAHACTRVQGGRPIIEHPNVSIMLAEMLIELEAARTLIWRAAWATDHPGQDQRTLALASKVFASQIALGIATKALEVHGRFGVFTEHRAEKYVRDAATFLHSEGANQILKLRLMNAVRGPARG
jgi:alkylation response protein AidB-like acyl-CoA dehydrogenase